MSHQVPEQDLELILKSTQTLWETLRGQSIFITGGTGFFGTWLLESLVYANDQLRLGTKAWVLTRNPEAFKSKAPHLGHHPAIRFIEGDVTTFEFPTEPCSHIIHAATPASAQLNIDDPMLMFDTIVNGTRRVLEFARICGAKRFLFTSSGAVYGPQPSDLTHIPENYSGAPDPLQPRSAYGEGKRVAEHLCTLYHQRYGIEPLIARCFAFVGPHLPMDLHFAIGNFIRDGFQGKTIQVQGDGTPYRSYLYAADLARVLWTILFQGQPCRAYHVGSDEDLTIRDLAHQVAEFFGVGVEIAGKPSLPGKSAKPSAESVAQQRYVPSIQRTKRDLSLPMGVPLPEAIQKTTDWLRQRKYSPNTSVRHD